MKSNLYIPTKIKVGFNKRDDTFTGKLGYVIYFDEKGVLRQENSWDGWRSHTIPAVEYENKPSKFLFNKDVSRYGYFGSGRSLIRVYDERDFEFEITTDNLMGILMNSDISKRDIVEPCVFAWSGKNLVLLPVNSKEYNESVVFTDKQSEKLSTKALVKGVTYPQKKSSRSLVYIGYYEWWAESYVAVPAYGSSYSRNSRKVYTNKGKKHIFYDGYEFKPYGITVLSAADSDAVCDNYAKLVDDYMKLVAGRSKKT